MIFKKNIKKFFIFFIFLVILGLIVFFAEVFYLKKAHSSFENYYAFRGCVNLIQKTDSYGICRLASGQEIKIVEYNGAWYLDGDLPGGWFNFQ